MSDLEIVLEASAGSRFRYPVGRAVWLGRDPECDVRLPSEVVSRRHARVRAEAGAIEVEDHSANGTRIGNGPLLRRCRHQGGAALVLGIGPYELRARVVGPQQPPAAFAGEGAAVLRRRIQRELVDHLDLARLHPTRIDRAAMRPRVLAALDRICRELGAELPGDRGALIAELADEALGLGPLEQLLHDPEVSEIMVIDAHTIYVERSGRIEQSGLRFTDDEAVRATIERIVTPLGRRIDESAPLVDARLPDGSRVNAIIPPLACRGPCITIRKFVTAGFGLSELVERGALSPEMAEFLCAAVAARKNVVISGGTGSGKTTLLNVLSSAVPANERIVTIEDSVELRLQQPHVVSLEARPENLEGKGAYTIRDLVRNALRMRPDRIIVGECRSGEAIDMLQAMNTGHEGSMTTTHANSPIEALARLEILCLMAGLDLPARAIRQQIATSVHLVVQQARFADGTRRVTSIGEVMPLDAAGELGVLELFRYERAPEPGGRGQFLPTGHLPRFAAELHPHLRANTSAA